MLPIRGSNVTHKGVQMLYTHKGVLVLICSVHTLVREVWVPRLAPYPCKGGGGTQASTIPL